MLGAYPFGVETVVRGRRNVLLQNDDHNDHNGNARAATPETPATL
jgi:hypothetical protein